ncbi:selenocysteine-specific translation elongation factor [Bacillus benzoevorans]|uniref:Selenocysteine-specific elongation factor n=1 Tax=Bacillus benzoevorans TaxID=1456 RepID=A0A7X0LWN6_9BACI|nr:selenocysteine-specific translation elongation factor [Bacillus benzoevorans]MBB6445574.1 selenocysteine-specific elongation factor [Bacillus benzoevorans]
MDHFVIGTAGHVDHGKTTLIKAMTGMETDTTAEEKTRGLSINLGFAYMDLPSGKRAGIVDVPGHEKFIKNMMAGLSGIQLILLVIDAGEGIMPQTKEHMDILQILGIKNYIIVLTKANTVDQELVELVEEDIKEQLHGTLLEDAPIYKVDSLSGMGINELIAEIDHVSQTIERASSLVPPRMHIDRVFSLKGFGTIVTGTLIEGALRINDELVIYPKELRTKIRNIQVHEQNVDEAVAGMRVALNLANVHVNDVSRGDTLAVPESVQRTWMIDVQAHLLPHAEEPLKLWNRLRLHIGTREILCRTVPIGVKIVEPGEEAFLQLRLEEEIVAKRGDKFIIRSYSPMHVIGGGSILDTTPTKHRRFNEEIIQTLETRAKGSTNEMIDDFVVRKEELLTSKEEVVSYLGISQTEINETMADMVSSKQLLPVNQQYMHPLKYEQFKKEMAAILEHFHKTYSLRTGIIKEELRSRIAPDLKGKDFDRLLQMLAEEKLIKNHHDTISLSEFTVTYNRAQLQEKEEIEQSLKQSGFTPPSEAELIGEHKERKEIIDSLVGKTIIRLDPETVIYKDYYDTAVEKVTEFIKGNGKMTLAEFRDMIGSNRKYSLIILEYLDKNKITRRVEDYRVLHS